MIDDPSINTLMKKFDSKYTLVNAVSKRARQLEDGAPKLTNCKSDKPVTIATFEISENKITYTRDNQEQEE